MFSSGAGSWYAARRVAEKHGTDNLVLLFTDVKGNSESPHAGEDEDNYRFLEEAAANIGGRLVVLNAGRDIYDVFHDEHMLGNTRVAPCSKQLKQKPARKWIAETYPDPADVVLYVGIDWSEEHRVAPNKAGWAPYQVEAPLTEPPYIDKSEMLLLLQEEGIKPPRLYDMGFQHANCGGFCVRMGHTQAKQLLQVMPDRYAYHERQEERFRQEFDKDVAFLRDRRGGTLKPMTLRTFRQRLEEGKTVDEYDWGGCGCFLD